MDARALASPNLTVLLVGNKSDIASDDDERPPPTSSSASSRQSGFPLDAGGSSVRSNANAGAAGGKWTATIAPEGREVTAEDASKWASKSNIPVSVEVSAMSGENVDDVFNRLARMILTKIELGEIDPDDPQSGIQYGDGGSLNGDGGSVKSGMTLDDTGPRRRKGRRRGGTSSWRNGMREWEEVFRVGPSSGSRRSGGCC